MAGCCGHGNEHWGSIKLDTYRNELSNYHVLKIRLTDIHGFTYLWNNHAVGV